MARLTAQALMAPGGLLDASTGLLNTLINAPLAAAEAKSRRERDERQADMSELLMWMRLRDELKPDSAGAGGVATRVGSDLQAKAYAKHAEKVLSRTLGHSFEDESLYREALMKIKASPVDAAEDDDLVRNLGLNDRKQLLEHLQNHRATLQRQSQNLASVSNPQAAAQRRQLDDQVAQVHELVTQVTDVQKQSATNSHYHIQASEMASKVFGGQLDAVSEAQIPELLDAADGNIKRLAGRLKGVSEVDALAESYNQAQGAPEQTTVAPQSVDPTPTSAPADQATIVSQPTVEEVVLTDAQKKVNAAREQLRFPSSEGTAAASAPVAPPVEDTGLSIGKVTSGLLNATPYIVPQLTPPLKVYEALSNVFKKNQSEPQRTNRPRRR